MLKRLIWLVPVIIGCCILSGCGKPPDKSKAPRLDSRQLAAREKLNQAEKLLSCGQYPQARDLLLQVMKINPESDVAAVGLCRVFLLSDQPGKAIEWGQKAV